LSVEAGNKALRFAKGSSPAMQTSMAFHVLADSYRLRADCAEAEQSRALLLQLAQTWETLAQAWGGLPPAYVSTQNPDSSVCECA
jgi:hypothetical protein